MTGGLIQLVATGAQDIALTQEPEITFFKIVYRRHTNFSLETIPQSFVNKPDFGRKTSCIISRNGDIIRKIHVVIELPNIPKFLDSEQNIDTITKFAWVNKIGYAIIQNVEIEIGSELIDKQYGDWLNIWNELTVSKNKKNLKKMIGDINQLTDYSNGKKSYKLIVPLQFWFNRIAGLALPVVCFQNNHIKINLELNDLNKCYKITPTHYINIDNDFVNFEKNEYLIQTVNNTTSLARFVHFDIIEKRLYIERLTKNNFQSKNVSSFELNDIMNDDTKYIIKGLNSDFEVMPQINSTERIFHNRSVNFKNISIKNCFLLVEYGFLDNDERIRFSQARHEYLIEQVVYNGEHNIDGLHQSFNVGFNQICKELIWVSQLNDACNNNQHFNYTDSLIMENDKYKGDNIITRETILFNGNERLSMRDSEYFTLVQPYEYHKNAPEPAVINVYSFSLQPEKHQPYGVANLNKISNIELKISVKNNINFENPAKLRVYGLTNNILRIAMGISGLVFV